MHSLMSDYSIQETCIQARRQQVHWFRGICRLEFLQAQLDGYTKSTQCPGQIPLLLLHLTSFQVD